MSARAKWMEMVVGDLPSVQNGTIDRQGGCINALPANVDDLHICGRDRGIDGQGGTLGSAGPLYLRTDPTTGKITTVTGDMNFDTADIPNQVARGNFEIIVLHEMGHVVGIGTLWNDNNLVDGNRNYLGTNAINVWKNDWGCDVDATPPVEKDLGVGSDGAHWDEKCLDRKIITGALNNPAPISTLTIASLEDIGYEVDYSVADEYNGTNTRDCCLSSSNLPSSEGPVVDTTPITPPLSDAGSAAAEAYGQEVLRENQRPDDLIQEEIMKENSLTYVGDRFVVVLYEEEERIYEVFVTNDELEPKL